MSALPEHSSNSKNFGKLKLTSEKLYAVRAPKTKCRIREITANTSNKWISPPATWNTVKPPIQAISRTTNKIVQMLICLSFTSRDCIPVPNATMKLRPVVCCTHNGNTVQDCSPEVLASRKCKTSAQPGNHQHDEQDCENTQAVSHWNPEDLPAKTILWQFWSRSTIR